MTTVPAGTNPASTAACTRQRIPLPLISATPPSALRRSIANTAGPVPPMARTTPSAPMPRWRSHRARTSAADSGRRSSGSSSTRKSLPAPWCLVRRSSPPSVHRPQSPISLSPSAPRVTAAGSGRARVRVDHIRSPPVPHLEELGQEISSRIEPGDARVAPEPRPLPAGEGPGPAGGLVHRLVQGHPLLHVRQQFSVSERLAGGARQPARTPGQGTDLVDEAGLEEPPESLLDASVVDGGVEADAHQRERRGRVGVEAGTERRERPARTQGHLQGADHPPAVGRFHAGGGGGIETRQPLVQTLGPSGEVGLHLERAQHLREPPRHRQAVDHGTQVEPRPAHEQGSSPRPSMPSSTWRASAWNRLSVNSSSGSTRSTR